MGEIKGGEGDVFEENVLPNIHLGPVGNGEDSEMFPNVFETVEEIPEFRALVARVPLAKFISKTKEAFFCPSFFLVSSCSAHGGIEFVFG